MKLISMRQDFLPDMHLEQHVRTPRKTAMRNDIVCLTTGSSQNRLRCRRFATRQIFMIVTV